MRNEAYAAAHYEFSGRKQFALICECRHLLRCPLAITRATRSAAYADATPTEVESSNNTAHAKRELRAPPKYPHRLETNQKPLCFRKAKRSLVASRFNLSVPPPICAPRYMQFLLIHSETSQAPTRSLVFD